MEYLLGILFANQSKVQYFLSEEELKIDTFVVAESVRGIELGKINTIKEYQKTEEENLFTNIIRIASEDDIKDFENNEIEAQEAIKLVQTQSDILNLGMKVTSADYTLDRSKLTISYLAEDRVDFRELLKVLASLYHCRIELRQIGPRDKAKLVGGIGLCGLPLCCSTFLNEFDGISITMAKNQMLALNIPKLSGHCGKLICCLKYEDEAYTFEKKNLPRIGLRVNYNDIIYRISSINIITKMVRLESPESIINVPLSAIEDKILYNYNPNQQQISKKEEKQEITKDNNVEEVIEKPLEEKTKPFHKKDFKNNWKKNNIDEKNELEGNQGDNIELEEQLIMNRIQQNNNNFQNNQNKKGNYHHNHKKFYRNRNKGPKNEEN